MSQLPINDWDSNSESESESRSLPHPLKGCQILEDRTYSVALLGISFNLINFPRFHGHVPRSPDKAKALNCALPCYRGNFSLVAQYIRYQAAR